ncbi:MAG: DNA polymerase III subunit beta [Deltaproteobacteria bacterium]|nr:DNA polymerase III subunit beta [Deltaproteobacteria bacterium]
MEFAVERNVFLEGIQRTLGIVEKKTTIPILSNILIEAGGDTIRIVATDREIGLVADYNATVAQPGKITVGARKLFEMIREIEEGSIQFKTMENNWVNITSGKVAYRIPGISADEFPEVPHEDSDLLFSVKADVLREMMVKTFFAISTDEMRPSLNGVYFEARTGQLEMVATDGHRLSLVTMDPGDDIPPGSEIDGVIIPRKGVSEVRKLIENEGETVKMAVHDGKCVFLFDHTLLRVSLIEGGYPDYRKVLPKDQGTEVLLDRNKFIHALRRMSVMSNERFSGVKIELSGNKMLLSSTNPDVGEAKDEIEVTYDGKEMEVGYSVRYLIDAIEVMSEDSVSFEMRGSEGPGVIRPVGNESYMCIVMPIKLREE